MYDCFGIELNGEIVADYKRSGFAFRKARRLYRENKGTSVVRLWCYDSRLRMKALLWENGEYADDYWDVFLKEKK